MNEQPTSPNEPVTEPVSPVTTPEPVSALTTPESDAPMAAQEPQGPPAGPLSAPPPVPPPAVPPPVYDWQRPTEDTGPAPGVRWAGYGARLIAYIVDGILVGVAVLVAIIVLALVAGALSNSGSDTAAGLTGLFILLAVPVITIGYFPYFWARGGQTPGMRMVRIRVVRDRDGGPLTGGQAVIRLIGLWIAGAVFYLGYIWVFIDGRRRGWHDLIAGTVVIEA